MIVPRQGLVFLLVFFINTVYAIEDAEVVAESAVAEQPPATDYYKGSEHVDAQLYFAEPAFGLQSENKPVVLLAGKRANVAVSVINNDESKEKLRFTLHSIEAALHYPQYYGYHVQNFTRFRLQNTLEPKQEASISYTFWPHLQLAGQSFDLAIVLSYHDQNGNLFEHSLFNKTVSLKEEEEGMDTQFIFMIVLQVAVVLLLGIGAYHWLYSSKSSASGRDTNTKAKTNAIVDTTLQSSGKPENEYIALLNKKTVHDKGHKAQLRNQGRR